MKQINNSFENNHFDLSSDPVLNITVCNAQPFQKLARWVFPLLAHLKKSYKF